MNDLQNIISFEVSKTIPVNLFRWPKYLWIDENSLVIKPYVLKSKYCDGWNGTYPAVTRKEIVKRIAKFISITQDVSGKTAINSLLKHSGLLPLEAKWKTKTPDELLSILIKVIDIHNSVCFDNTTTKKEEVTMNTVTIKNPNEPATDAQKKVIGHAVKQGEYPRFEADKWQALTKGEAAGIITELRGDKEIPASNAQKRKLSDLIHRGFRKGLKRETFANLTSDMAKNMIWHAVQQEKTGKTIEGFVPRQRLAPNAPATERQKNRLTQLINDGFVPRITPQLWAKMTHEQATEQITRGKLAEQRVARQAA